MNLLDRLNESKKTKKTEYYGKLFVARKGESIKFRILGVKDQLFGQAWLHNKFNNPKTNFSEPLSCIFDNCPLCNHVQELSDKEGYHQNAWKYNRSKYAIYWVYDVNKDKVSLLHIRMKGVKDSKSVNDQLIAIIESEIPKGESFNITLSTNETSGYTASYSFDIDRDVKELSESQVKLVKTLPDFKDVYAKKSTDELADIVKYTKG